MSAARIFNPLLIAVLLTPAASHCGSQAETLQLPTASFVSYAPLCMVASYWGCLFLLRWGQVARYREVIGLAAGVFFAAWPFVLLHSLTAALPLPRWLTQEERLRLKAVFPHPFVLQLATGEGFTIRVRRSDQCEALSAFVASIR